jgi:hypothetical protein
MAQSTNITLLTGSTIKVPVDPTLVIPDPQPLSTTEMIVLLEQHHTKRTAIAANKRKRKKDED